MCAQLSLRAAILLAFVAIGNVSARHVDGTNKVAVKKHRRRGRCSPSYTASSTSLSIVPSVPPTFTLTPTSTLETIVITPTTSASESPSASESDTFSAPSESTTTVDESASITLPEETSTYAIVTSTDSTSSSALSISSSESSTSGSVSSASSSESPTSTAAITSTSEEALTTATSAAITSSAAPCEPTVSTWAPELCWRSVPDRCNSMTVTTAPAATLTGHINACATNLQVYDGQLASEVSDCFANIGQPEFNPTSAYSCITSAPIYCRTISACAPAPTSNPVIPPYDNPSFESGTLGSWTEVPATTPNNLHGSITTEQTHSGQHSLKIQYNNLADDFIAWEHRVLFEPGVRYEVSFWYYSVSNQSRGTLALKVAYPGTSLPLAIQMANQGTGRWIQQKFSLIPSTSFGTVSVTYSATKGVAGNIIYVDDITLTKVG